MKQTKIKTTANSRIANRGVFYDSEMLNSAFLDLLRIALIEMVPNWVFKIKDAIERLQDYNKSIMFRK